MLFLVYRGLIISIICFGVSLAMSEEMLEMAKMLHDTCVEESGVDESVVTSAGSGNFAEDNKLKCYMKCLLEQVSAMTDDGDIDVDVIISMMPEEVLADIEPVIRGCGTVKGADDCDTAFQTQKCYHSKSGDKYFLI